MFERITAWSLTMKHVQAITRLLLMLSALGLSGCEQAQNLATRTVETAKKEVIAEIAKTLKGEDQAKSEG